MLFSYNFGDKKTDEKAFQSMELIPEYGKNACYKISYYGKNAICYFVHLLLAIFYN